VQTKTKSTFDKMLSLCLAIEASGNASVELIPSNTHCQKYYRKVSSYNKRSDAKFYVRKNFIFPFCILFST
jgi:hypothetical protein